MAPRMTVERLGMAAEYVEGSPYSPVAMRNRTHRLSAEVHEYGAETQLRRSGEDDGDIQGAARWVAGNTETPGEPRKGRGESGSVQLMGELDTRDPYAPRRTVVRDLREGTTSLLLEPIGQPSPQVIGTTEQYSVCDDSDDESYGMEGPWLEEQAATVAPLVPGERRWEEVYFRSPSAASSQGL